MRATKMEDLLVWQKGRELERAITALCRVAAVRNDRVLRDQMNAASVSVVSNISEGFEQSTDRAFARYLGVARGSASELRAQIHVCIERHRPPSDLTAPPLALSSEVIRMLTSLIRYLRQSNWSERRSGTTTVDGRLPTDD
jgi:four helix bundle protein